MYKLTTPGGETKKIYHMTEYEFLKYEKKLDAEKCVW